MTRVLFISSVIIPGLTVVACLIAWLLRKPKSRPIRDSKRWFYEKNGLKIGPVGYLDLVSLVVEGRIGVNTPVSDSTSDSWHSLDDPHQRVAVCGLFDVLCRKRWEALNPTQNPGVRHCEECGKDVHICTTVEELKRRGAEGYCAALLAGPHAPILIGLPSPPLGDLAHLFRDDKSN